MTSSRFPDPADPFEEEGLPATDNALPGKQITGDAQDDIIVPTDRPYGVTEYGTTALEEAEGEPLSLRLSRETPDVLTGIDDPDVDPSTSEFDDPGTDPDEVGLDTPYPSDPDERVGRLVSPDEGAHADEEKDEVAQSFGTDGGGFSAEERAMHLEPGQ